MPAFEDADPGFQNGITNWRNRADTIADPTARANEHRRVDAYVEAAGYTPKAAPNSTMAQTLYDSLGIGGKPGVPSWFAAGQAPDTATGLPHELGWLAPRVLQEIEKDHGAAVACPDFSKEDRDTMLQVASTYLLHGASPAMANKVIPLLSKSTYLLRTVYNHGKMNEAKLAMRPKSK